MNEVIDLLWNRSGFLEKIGFRGATALGHYKPFQHGHYFKQNHFIGAQWLQTSLGLYIDDFESCNPLSNVHQRKVIRLLQFTG